ncbi:MAG TPA: hypothetical protein P5539_15020 [Mesotoga sp.]|nr:hypothetical protein [Mesotoga sp.]
MLTMEESEVLWRLYERKTAYTKEYNEARNLTRTVMQVFNPVRKIINTDKALLLKGLKVSVDEKYSEALEALKDWNNWDFLKTRIALFILMEGYVGVQAVPVNDGKAVKSIDLVMYEKSQVQEVKRDASGQVTYVELHGFDDEENPIVIKISETEFEYFMRGEKIEEKSGVNAWGFVPFIEFFGLSGKDETIGLGRVDSIADSIDLVNKLEWDLREISDLHANPPIVGKFGEIEDDTQNEHTNQEEGFEYITQQQSRKYARIWDMEEGTAKYLEMQGNVMKIAAEEKERIKQSLMKEYPELLLAEIASGSGLSGYAIALKLTDLVSVIEDYRSRLKESLKDIWNMTGKMLGFNWNVEVSFQPVLNEDAGEKIGIISEAVAAGLLPKQIGSKLVVNLLDIDETPEKVWEMIEQENETSANVLRAGTLQEMAEDNK